MNSVQRNFKRQMKQIEQVNKHRWRREKYRDRYTGKTYYQYFDQHGTLLKTEERKSSIFKTIAITLSTVFVLVIVTIIAVTHALYIPKSGMQINLSTTSLQQTTTTQDITLEQVKSVWENHILYITGTVHNISGKTLRSVHINAVIKNSQNIKIDSVNAEAKNLKKDESWNFKIPVNNSTGAKSFAVTYTVL